MTKHSTWFRALLATNAVVVAVGLMIKFVYAARDADPLFRQPIARVLNEFCYFTIQSNLIVLGVCAALLLGRSERGSRVLDVFRFVALICIIVTGIVYRVLLAADAHFTGVEAVGDALVHSISPVLYVFTWLVFGPRRRATAKCLAGLLTFVGLWVGFTLVRGSISHFYPYDFIDVSANGYSSVLATIAGMTLGAVLLALAAMAYDRRHLHLTSDRPATDPRVHAG
jgi:hypothetical protein